MSWSYSGDPTTSPKDAVRFEIQDTNEAMPLLSDEEINAILAKQSSVLRAAARCCEILATRFAQQVDTRFYQSAYSSSQRYQHYRELAADLRRRAASAAGPYLASADRVARSDDVESTFSVGMMDNKG